jgi:DNA polymerase-3 subunit delta'
LANWNLVGHELAVRELSAVVTSGRVPHAWIFTGQEGIGRTTLALSFARTLNCERPVAERPCNSCSSCLRIPNDRARLSHPDVTLADLAWQAEQFGGGAGREGSVRGEFSIEAVRWLRQDISLRPVQGSWKVQIVDQADRLSFVAPDAFLKTLEEPPPFAVIILISESLDAVPETIRSRCRHLALGHVPRLEISAALMERGVTPPTAERIAAAARGRVAWALELAEDGEEAALRELQERAVSLNQAIEQITTPLGRAEVVTGLSDSKARERRDARLREFIALWREALLIRAGLAGRVALPETGGALRPYAEGLTVQELQAGLRATLRCVADLEANMQARIALLAMVTEWPPLAVTTKAGRR